MASSIVSFTVTNPATANVASNADKSVGTITDSGASTAIMYDNVSATLNFVVTNQTGSDVKLPAGSKPLSLRCPRCFTESELQTASFTAPTGMTSNPHGPGLDMTVGTTDLVWANGAALTFSLSSLTTAGPDNTYLFTLLLNVPNLPRQVTANLAVQAAPVDQNADLSTVLNITFQPNNTDTVYVSTIQPYLLNTLLINFNNSSGQPIFSGTVSPGKPQVNVSFTYGADAGSLAPMEVAQQIQAGIWSDEGNQWNSQKNSENDSLTWQLKPQSSNPIGVGSHANITFSFENIMAPTAGNNITQVFLQFLGFWQTETVAYNPWSIYLNIAKLVTPPQRGLANFQSTTTGAVGVASPTEVVNVEFTWDMSFVASVKLSYALGGNNVTAMERTYDKQIASASDSFTVPISGFIYDTMVIFQLDSCDENKNTINSLQWSVFFQANFFRDPRDFAVYSATQIGGQLWMTQNLAWASPGSLPVNGNATNTPSYGLLYPYSDASTVPETVDAWRLPSQADYTPFSSLSFTQLTSSGPGLLSLQQGGFALSGPSGVPNYSGFGANSFCWTSTTDDSGNYPMAYGFDASSSGTEFDPLATGLFPPQVVGLFYLSVRYVRDVPTTAEVEKLCKTATTNPRSKVALG